MDPFGIWPILEKIFHSEAKSVGFMVDLLRHVPCPGRASLLTNKQGPWCLLSSLVRSTEAGHMKAVESGLRYEVMSKVMSLPSAVSSFSAQMSSELSHLFFLCLCSSYESSHCCPAHSALHALPMVLPYSLSHVYFYI